MTTSSTLPSRIEILHKVLPLILGQPGALPDDWHIQATTYDLTRFHSETTFADQFYVVAQQILEQKIQAPDQLRELLATCGLPYDYARLGQPLSTLFEMYLQEWSHSAHVISFASRTKPYLSVIEAQHKATRVYAAGILPLSEVCKQRLRAQGVELYEQWSGPIPEVPAGVVTLWVSDQAFHEDAMQICADGLCFPVEEGGVLLIPSSSKVDVAAVRVVRKRTAAALLASSALAELQRLLGLAISSPPSKTQPEDCERLLRELFPEVAASLYFCTGLAAEAAVFSAVAEEMGDLTFFYAQNGYGGTGQLLGEILPREGKIKPVPLPVLSHDEQGRTVTLVERIVGSLAALNGTPACVFLEMPTNPELQLHDFDGLMAALRDYRDCHGITVPVLVDTTFAPLYPLFSQAFARDWPFLCVKSGSKYFTRGKATLGVAFCADQPVARSILERAHRLGQDNDTLARPLQLTAALGGLSGLRPRLAKIAAKTQKLAAWIESAITARGRSMTLYHVTDEAVAAGLATGILSFYLPPAPTVAPDLVDEFVDYMLKNAPELVKNRVSYGQFAGDGKPDYVYIINPQESTQGSLSAEVKAAQKKDNVQICRISVSEHADLDALIRVMEAFFDLKYGAPQR